MDKHVKVLVASAAIIVAFSQLVAAIREL